MTMAVEFKPATLDSAYDNEAMLLFRNGRLMAVLARLGEAHEDLQGHWFIEKTFTSLSEPQRRTFADLADAEAWASELPAHD
jgi:hypothetical protein